MTKSYANKRLMAIDFSGQDLTGADFSGSAITGCQFVGTILRAADFTGARGTGCNFDEADLSDSRFDDARFMGTTFRNTVLAGSNLENASLMGCDLAGAVNEVEDEDVEDEEDEEGEVEDDEVKSDDETDSEYEHQLNFGWIGLGASEHLVGVTLTIVAHLVEGQWVQIRSLNVAMTDCMIRIEESANREVVLTIVRPGITDSHVETIAAGDSSSLIDESDDSWAVKVTNQL